MDSLYGPPSPASQAPSQPRAQLLLSQPVPVAAQALAPDVVEGRQKKAPAPKRSYQRKDKAEKEAKIPRPPNAFILFRSDTQPTLVDSFRGAGKSSRDYSASIAKMWAEATPEVKQKYNDLAAEKMYQHRQRYPDYRYRPKRNAPAASATRLKPAGLDVNLDDEADYVLQSERARLGKGGNVGKVGPKGRRSREVATSPSQELFDVSMSNGDIEKLPERAGRRKSGKAGKAKLKVGLSHDKDSDMASSPSLSPELVDVFPRTGECEEEESYYFDNMVVHEGKVSNADMDLDTPPVTSHPSSVSTPFIGSPSLLDAKISSAILNNPAPKRTRTRMQQFTSLAAPDETSAPEPELTGRALLLHFQQELSLINTRLFELEEENERVRTRYGLPPLVIRT